MNRKKVQSAGKKFGRICKILGSVLCIISCIMVPNEDKIVNKGGCILLAVSLIIYGYGAWRTKSIIIEME